MRTPPPRDLTDEFVEDHDDDRGDLDVDMLDVDHDEDEPADIDGDLDRRLFRFLSPPPAPATTMFVCVDCRPLSRLQDREDLCRLLNRLKINGFRILKISILN